MPQGQGVPTCQSQNLTGIVWSPTANSTYQPGQTFAITFTTLNERDIEHGRDYYFSVWVTCLDQSNLDYATVKILDKQLITSLATFPNGRWRDFYDCGDTSVSYNWTIPLDLNTTEPEWKVYVQNGTETNPWPEGKIAESDIFRIEPKDISSSSSSSSSTLNSPTSTTAAGQTEASTIVTPTSSQFSSSETAGSAGLSKGAIAGISVGVGLFVVFLATGLFLLGRRRSRPPARSTEIPVAEQYEKPELEGNPPPGDGAKEIGADVGGRERYEIDGRSVKVLQQEPIELAAEQT